MQRCGCIAISFTFMLTCLKSTLGPTCTTLLFTSLSPGHGWKVESRRSVMPLRHHVGRLVRILSIGRGTIHRKGEKRATTLSTQWPWTSADKCQVRQVTNPKTPGGISHTEMLWEPSCELFLALVCTLRWAYITLSSCTTSCCVCLYDMAKRQIPAYVIKPTQWSQCKGLKGNFKYSISTLRIPTFWFMFSHAVNSLFTEQRFDSVFHRSMASTLQHLWHDETLLTLYAYRVWAASKVPG